MRTLRSLVLTVIPLLSVTFVVLPAHAVDPDQTSIVSDDPVNNTPDVLNGNVNAIAQIGDTVYVGGKFANVQERGSAVVTPKANLFAFSASTGQLSATFNPVLKGGGVDDIVVAPDGQSLYIAGWFSKVNDLPKLQKVARISATTGAPVNGFESPNPNGRVSDLNLANGRLYLSGQFTTFKTGPRELIAAIDPTTGADTGVVNFDFADTWHGGFNEVKGMDVTPDGQKLVAVGNWRNVNGQSRPQVVMFDLNGGGTATLSSWATTRFTTNCSATFETYMRDVEFSPDSSYFVIVTTGAYSGGPGANTLCDTASRWETSATGSGLNPSWVDYTGGDTLTRVAVTSAAVYVGGHMRWMNNPSASDARGPGGVVRTGLTALDPRNGLPFSWNPTRARGYGVFEFTVTNNGLWMGHDTRLVHGEVRSRLAYFPLAGGTGLPAEVVGTLPGFTYLLGSASTNNVVKRSFNGVTTGASSSVDPAGQAWGSSRGSWVIDGQLYTGWTNGTLTVRPFANGVFGGASTVELNGLTAFGTELASMNGAFYDRATGRLYYTLAGQTSLFYRYFTPEDRLVGGLRFTAQASIADVPWSSTGGMFLAGGKLYFTSTSTGNLYSINWTNGQAVQGTRTTLGGPTVDGNDWRTRGLVLTNS